MGAGKGRMEGGGQAFSSMLVLHFGGSGPAPELPCQIVCVRGRGQLETCILRPYHGDQSLTQPHLFPIQAGLRQNHKEAPLALCS